MKKLQILFGAVMLVLLIAACGRQNTPTSVPVHVDMSVRAEPEPLTVGDTTLVVSLKDASALPIDGATLQVHGDMDHEGMTSVDREISESSNGTYQVPFEWTMGGGWIVTITAKLPDNKGEITDTFNFFVEAVSSESVINRHSSMNVSDVPDVNILYQSDGDPAHGGDATVTISLTDSEHKPITDASVYVTGDMAHEGMMPITGEGSHSSGGQYVVPLYWTMAGDWIVTVSVTLSDGRQSQAVFNQKVVFP